MYGDTAFAEASPWERLYQWNAHYCFVGVDFTVNTMGHYCQCRLIGIERPTRLFFFGVSNALRADCHKNAHRLRFNHHRHDHANR